MLIKSFDGEELYFEKVSVSPDPNYNFLFLHGVGGDCHALLPLAKSVHTLLPDSSIYLLDQRGHGLSSKKFAAPITSIEEYLALDLQFVIKKLALKKVIVVGHSLGSIALQTYLTQKLEPTEIFPILISPPRKALSLLFFNRTQWFALSRKWGNKNHHRQLPISSHLQYANTHDLNLFRIWQDITHTGILHWLSVYGSLLGWKTSLTKNYKKGLVILGEKDVLLPINKNKKEWETQTDFTVKVIGGNHISVFTHYPEIAKIIVEALRQW